MNHQERQDLVNHRLNRAIETLSEIDILVKNKLWSTAVNRLYYACYYAVNALLVKYEVKAETHGGVRRMFGLKFVKTGLVSKETGKFYSDIFDIRHSSDYDDFIELTQEKTLELISPAKKLIQEIETILNSNK
jgi:uncharacterized protein (UPF0332 family)